MMRRLFLAFCLISSLGSVQLASGQQSTGSASSTAATQAIVSQFYPQQLVDPAYPNDRNSCFGVMQLGQDGSPSVIVADYLNARGAIRVLTRGANGMFTATDGPTGLNLDGSNCSIEFIDFDGDGINEIHVAISGAGVGTADWLFRWNDSALTTLNPVTLTKASSFSQFGNASFVDLYHDGTLAVYCVQTYPPPQDGASDEPDRVYRWQNGQFRQSASALLLVVPVGSPGSPFTADFGVAKGSTGPYTLRIINGDTQGNHRASGQVLINGQNVTSFQLTGDSISSSSIRINGSSDNQLTVDFNAVYTDGYLAIVVEDASPASKPPSLLSALAVSSSQIKLSFLPSVSTGVYAYRVYRDIKSGVAPSPSNLVRASQLSPSSFSDYGLSPSTTYYYVVDAINGYGPSVPSNEASATTNSQTKPITTTPPSAPTGLSVQALGTQNNLSWIASGTVGVRYSVFRSIVSGFSPLVSNRIANNLTATRYVDTGLNPSTTYYYLAKAVNSAGSSPASNQATATFAQDNTPPTIQCGSPDQLWHASDVSIACTASDFGSGLANPADALFLLTSAVPAGTETANAATGTHQVCDKAGNCATAGPISGIMIDRMPPSITITTPATSQYVLNQSVTASYSCADGGSGLATCSGPVPSGTNFNTKVVGIVSFAVSASDNVGNTSNASVSYTVAYKQCLLYDPTKAAKSGSTIPIKLQLCDAQSNDVSAASVVVHASSLVQTSTNASLAVVDAGNANPGNDFRFDPTLGPTGGYIFNLKTTGLSTGTYELVFTTGSDPTTHIVYFQVR